MKLSANKKMTMKKHPSFVSVKQRIIALFTAAVMMLQICLPTVAWAASVLSNESITAAMASPAFQKSSSNAYLYEQASYDDASYITSQNITTFRERLVAAKTNLGKPTLIPIASDITIFIPTYPTGKLIGDAYVQNRYIRQQVFDLLGRHLIDASSSNISEDAQINTLYEAAFAFAQANPAINFGDNLDAATLAGLSLDTGRDMIWPEVRVINNESVVVPILYLKTSTINANKVTKTKTEFTGSVANLGSITLNHAELTLGANTIVKTAGNLTATKVSLIASGGDINLVVGGTLNLIGSTITGVKNVNIFANEVNVKSVLVPFQDRYGSGTKLGSIASINSVTGNISLTSTGNINFEAGMVNASNGSLTIGAAGNISIQPLFPTYQEEYTNDHWEISASALDVIGSRLSAQDKITLMAQGGIDIRGSELMSTQGGIELLAGLGIYVADEQGYFQSSRVDRFGRTTGTGSDYESFAVRSVLSAGRNILLSTNQGDVVLKGAVITSADGTTVKANNGKVRLLITKENSQHYLDTVKTGTWTIKTVHEEYIKETSIPNAIVGGLAVDALLGVDVEYTGREGATLQEQIAEYKKMPDTVWMADIYEGRTLYKNAQGNLVPLNQTVDFSKVDLAYKYIRDHNTNLSPAAMAVIAICVAVAMGPAGASLVGPGGVGSATATIGGITTTTVFMGAAATQAAMLTLTTSAAQNLASGKGLDGTLKAMTTDDALKNLAVSMATAGALNSLGNVELFANAPTGSGLELANQAYQAVTSSVVSAGVSLAISGGNSNDFKEIFVQSLAMDAINSVGESLANKIGDAAKLPENQRISIGAKYISHAALGCMTGALTSQLSDADKKLGCASGAGGALIGEYVGSVYADQLDEELKDWIDESIAENGPRPTREQQNIKFAYFKSKGVDLARLAAAFGAFATGGDVNIAANSGQNAAQNNALSLVLGLLEYLKLNGDGDVLKGLAAVGAREDYLTQVYDKLVGKIDEYGRTAYKLAVAGHEEDITVLAAVLNELYKASPVGMAHDAGAHALTTGVNVLIESPLGERSVKAWNELDERERNQLKGAGRIVEISLDVAALGRMSAVKSMIDTPNIDVAKMINDKDHPDWSKVDNNIKLNLLPPPEYRVPNGYLFTKNVGEAATITGPKGGSYKSTGRYTPDGTPIYQSGSGSYYAMSESGVVRVHSPFEYSKDISISNPEEAWRLVPIERGIAIERYLARGEYSTTNGWHHVGAERGGTFPLVDFQKENVLVSLKTVDTKGRSWQGDMQEHIDDLNKRRGTVDNINAVMSLDIRVQPGGAAAAKFLEDYGHRQNVIVKIYEF